MRPSQLLAQHRDALLEIARRNGVSNLRVFGSIARGEDTDGSDVDLLVDAPKGTTYFDLARIKREAESLTGIAFDIHTAAGLKARVRGVALRDAKPL
jgi:predicted nucleotidyltransferase